MTDTDTAAQANGAGGQVDPADLPQFRIVAQYIKDLSFENPNSPDSFRANEEAPKTDVGIDVQAKKREEPDHYEADIKLVVTSKRGDDVVFLIELIYGGVFVIKNIAPENLQPMLLIECPRMLFPFARRIIADVARDGGFPPLMIDPIDFGALYRAQLEAAQQQASNQAAGGVVPEVAS